MPALVERMFEVASSTTTAQFFSTSTSRLMSLSRMIPGFNVRRNEPIGHLFSQQQANYNARQRENRLQHGPAAYYETNSSRHKNFCARQSAEKRILYTAHALSVIEMNACLRIGGFVCLPLKLPKIDHLEPYVPARWCCDQTRNSGAFGTSLPMQHANGLLSYSLIVHCERTAEGSRNHLYPTCQFGHRRRVGCIDFADFA